MIGALACGVLALVSCHKEQTAAKEPASVKVFPIQEQQVTDYGQWFGYMRGAENTNIMPHVTGFLVSQEYKDGTKVKAGDVLFRIDDSLYRAAKEQADADLAAAEATLENAKARCDQAALDVKRYEPLAERGAVSEKQYADALQTYKADQAAVEAAQAAIDQQKAAVEKAQVNLDYTVVRAPYDGIVGAAAASVGALVDSTTVLANMTAVDPIRVDFSINGDSLLDTIRRFGPGDPDSLAKQRIDLLLENGTTYEHPGHVMAAESKLSTTGLLNIEGTIPNPNGLLRDGMAVRVRTALDTHDSYLVPKEAIQTVLRGSFIIILDRQGAPHMLAVTTGQTYTVEVREQNGYVSQQPMVAVSDAGEPLADLFRKYGYDKPTDVPVVSDADTAVKASAISASNSRLAKGEKPQVVKPVLFTFKPELSATMKAVLSDAPPNPEAKATLPAFPVKVFPLMQQDVTIPAVWFGSLRGVDETDILPKVTGFVMTCNFRDGDMVKKGDVLYTLDPAPFKAQADEAKSNLEAAKAELREAQATLEMKKTDYDRYNRLNKATPGAVSDKVVTDAETAVLTAEAGVKSAQATIAQAEAALNQANIDLGYTTIIAPFDGRIGITKASLGDLVSPSDTTPMVTLSSVNPMRVDFNVSGLGALNGLRELIKQRKANTLPTFAVVLDDGTVFPERGQVVTADNALNKGTGTLQIIGHVANPEATLRSGMSVRVRADMDMVKGAWLVPFRAPLSQNGKDLLVLLAKNNAPIMMPITKGEMVTVTTKNDDGTEVEQPMQIIDVDRSTVTALILAKTQATSLEELVFKAAGVDSWQALLAKNGGPADAPDARDLVLKAAGAEDELDLIAKNNGYASVMEMALKNSGFDDPSQVRVVVEGSIAAAQTYMANEKAGAPVNVLAPSPFRYVITKTVTPSITADKTPAAN